MVRVGTRSIKRKRECWIKKRSISPIIIYHHYFYFSFDASAWTFILSVFGSMRAAAICSRTLFANAPLYRFPVRLNTKHAVSTMQTSTREKYRFSSWFSHAVCTFLSSNNWIWGTFGQRVRVHIVPQLALSSESRLRIFLMYCFTSELICQNLHGINNREIPLLFLAVPYGSIPLLFK